MFVFQGLLAANRLPAHLTAARNEYVPPTKKPAGKLPFSVKNLKCVLLLKRSTAAIDMSSYMYVRKC